MDRRTHKGARFRGRCAVLGAIATAVLAAWATSAALAASTGAITGTVKEAGAEAPLSGIEVCAFEPPPAVATEEEEEKVAEPPCSPTGAAGEYTLNVPAPAGYWVMFNPPIALVEGKRLFSQRNYVAQAWEDSYTEATAKVVPVSPGATVTGIDAALEPGGEISGRVTAAATGGPAAGVFVCALASGADERLGEVGCAEASSGGEYTIYGLAPGAYDVIFFGPGYAPQIYDGKSTPAEATLVNLTRGQVVAGVDAALAPRTESPSPSESETPAGGPGGPTPTRAGGLGSGPLLALGSRVLAVVGGRADVVLACHMATRCHGRLRLYVSRRVRRGRRVLVVREPLGGRSFRLAPGHRRTFAIRLDRRGVALLRADHGRAEVKLSVDLGGAGVPDVLAVRLSSARRS
jgi:hypothetical protein